ncbi:hypothetical protein LINPERPRIM_LOCUS8794 [Linum perenne]
MFESAAKVELNRIRSSLPPKFKFMRDTKDKLLRRLLEEANNGDSVKCPVTAAKAREGSFLGVSKNKEPAEIKLWSRKRFDRSEVERFERGKVEWADGSGGRNGLHLGFSQFSMTTRGDDHTGVSPDHSSDSDDGSLRTYFTHDESSSRKIVVPRVPRQGIESEPVDEEIAGDLSRRTLT